jgi:hypothetical protein
MGPEISVFLAHCYGELQPLLGARLIGLYLYGSLAMEEFVPGKSDLDVLAVVSNGLTDDERARLLTALAAIPLPSTARGLDLCVGAVSVTRQPSADAGWEAMIQVNRAEGGVDVRDRKRRDPRLPLDLALARQCAITLVGPNVKEVISPVPDALVRSASVENVRLWASRDVFYDPSSGILNVCRAWRYHQERVLSSKRAGGGWALAKGIQSDLVDAALRTHRGEPWPAIPDAEVKRFFQYVLRAVDAN